MVLSPLPYIASGWEVALRGLIILAAVGVITYAFGVLLPRVFARKCPKCRAVLTREPTDQWKSAPSGDRNQPGLRLVRFKCPACDFQDERWIRPDTVMAGRPAAADSRDVTEADLQTEFRGQVPDGMRKWLDKAKEQEDKK